MTAWICETNGGGAGSAAPVAGSRYTQSICWMFPPFSATDGLRTTSRTDASGFATVKARLTALYMTDQAPPMGPVAAAAKTPGVLYPEPAGPVNFTLVASGKLSSDVLSKSGATVPIWIGVAASVGVCAPPMVQVVLVVVRVSDPVSAGATPSGDSASNTRPL